MGTGGFDVTKFGSSGDSGKWNYYEPSFTNAVPNLVWQNTTSNATYCSASSALT